MDSVRFGRALGTGARLAAKTIATAVDAATSPSPTAGIRDSDSGPERSRVAEHLPEQVTAAGRRAGQATRQARVTGKNLARGGGQFGRSVWGPFAKFSGVLWLELTGVFFGLFAVSGAIAAWRLHFEAARSGWQGPAYTHMALSAGVAVLFAYFCVSSFLRARRRERGPG